MSSKLIKGPDKEEDSKQKSSDQSAASMKNSEDVMKAGGESAFRHCQSCSQYGVSIDFVNKR